MIDVETIINLFRNLDTYLEVLRQLASLPKGSFSDDPIRIGAAKYYLQVSIESCLDVANHIIARQGLRAPESYTDAFTILADNEIIEPSFLRTASRMVGMRNRLVHLYWEVDADILYDTLQHNLGDFDRFKAYILRLVQSRDKPSP